MRSTITPRMIAWWNSLPILLLLLTTGCTSLRTTFFSRLEDDTLLKENEKPVHGLPVMVKVPTHLELRVEEIVHLVREPNTTNLHTLSPDSQLLRSVQADLRFTEKMFVLDPKRPASGTAAYGMTFQSKPKANSNAARDAAAESAGHGYLQGLKYKVDDQTITNVTAFLANIAPLLASPIAAEPSSEMGPVVGLYTTQRTIAFGLFDLASPDFENEVNSFLELHLNACQPCNAAISIHSSQPLEFVKPVESAKSGAKK